MTELTTPTKVAIGISAGIAALMFWPYERTGHRLRNIRARVLRESYVERRKKADREAMRETDRRLAAAVRAEEDWIKGLTREEYARRAAIKQSMNHERMRMKQLDIFATEEDRKVPRKLFAI